MKTYSFFFKARIKNKKVHCVLEFNQSQWLKSYIEFNTQKRTEADKNGDKEIKLLYKTIENLRNRID